MVPKITREPEMWAGDPKAGILEKAAQLQQVSTSVMGGGNLHHSWPPVLLLAGKQTSQRNTYVDKERKTCL